MKFLPVIFATLLGTQAHAAINNTAAADAYYSALKSSLGWTPTPADDTKNKAAYEAAFGALLNYIKANANVLPNTLANPAGQPVATTGSATAQTGATTAPATITGTGVIQ